MRGAEQSLAGPVQDATDMANWLAQQSNTHVTLVTSHGTNSENWTVHDYRPNFGDVERPLNDLVDEGEILRNGGYPVTLGRRLTIYMAGHGFAPRNKHLALITAEANQGRMASIEASSWADWFADQTHFDEIILLMDCCTIADYAQTSRGPIGLRNSRRAGGMARMVTIFAAAPDQLVYEQADAKGLIRGVFTAELLKALNGAAAEPNGSVTTSSLERYFQSIGLTGSNSTTADKESLPRPSFRDRDDLILATGTTLPTYRIHTGVAEGTEIDIQYGGNASQSRFKGPCPANGIVELPLAVGLYAVRSAGRSAMFEIGSRSGRDVHAR
jgi:hypothetical protein